MNEVLGLALLVQTVLLSIILGMSLMVIFKIRRMFKRALTLVLTISFKPKWKRL